jgi:hypothetical protein
LSPSEAFELAKTVLGDSAEHPAPAAGDAPSLNVHEQHWLSIRSQVIDALRERGLQIVTTAHGVHIMALGKITAACAPPAPEGDA